MTKRNDWMPGSRGGQVELGSSWVKITQPKKADWNIAEEAFARVSAAVQAAEEDYAKPPMMRNAVDVANGRRIFKELQDAMRDFKKRYFYIPPLNEGDIVQLGLRLKDTEPTPVLDPVGIAKANITFPASMQMILHIQPVEGSQDDARAYYGVRIYYDLCAANETPPLNGKHLRLSRFTRRKKERFIFQPEDTGKTAYFSIRYENSKGKAGPWGPMFSAIIP